MSTRSGAAAAAAVATAAAADGACESRNCNFCCCCCCSAVCSRLHRKRCAPRMARPDRANTRRRRRRRPTPRLRQCRASSAPALPTIRRVRATSSRTVSVSNSVSLNNDSIGNWIGSVVDGGGGRRNSIYTHTQTTEAICSAAWRRVDIKRSGKRVTGRTHFFNQTPTAVTIILQPPIGRSKQPSELIGGVAVVVR